MMKNAVLAVVIFIVTIFVADRALAQVAETEPPELSRIGVDEHLGDKIPLAELNFVSDDGDSVEFAEFFSDGKPVILTLYYSDCPMLCSLVLTGLEKAVQHVEYTAGIDYRLLTVSIDPSQTVEKSSAGRERFGGGLPQGSKSDAWRFFTGDSGNINRLTQAVGFRYFYDEERKEYAHPAVVMVLTPDGTISRYLFGIEFKPTDVRLALLEASQGKIGSTIDRVLLYCYHYDPNSKGYVLMAGQIMKIGGAVTLVIFVGLLAGLWIRDRGRG